MVVTNNRTIFAALAVFTVAVAISSVRIVREYEFIGSKFIPNLWVAAQAEIEFFRFVDQLGAHVHHGNESSDELATRLYVLWSRLPLILQGGSESEHVRAVAGAVQTVEALTATLERLEPTILALGQSDVAAHREIYTALNEFKVPLHQIVAKTMQKDEEVAASQREGIRAVYWEVLWCFLGMVASAVILVVLLLRAVRNVSSLLRVAHAAEAAAAQASRAKSEFLAAMSHEIRTPLTGVLGMADLLAAAELPEKERRYADAIRTSGRHLLAVINDILDFSRIEAGKLELERVNFAVTEVLEQVRSLMAPQAAERGLELGFELDEHSPPVVEGDPTRLRQVLLNLVGNGLKFTHQGGVAVRVGSHLEEDGTVRFRFAVRDTGIGIAPDKQGELFADFTQADRSTSRTYGGSGLGLAICKRLVLVMGGVIGVDSAPGQGSTFWFEVPLQLGDALAVAKRSAFAPIDVRPLRVLVADDVPANRELLEEMLGRHGHAVVCAENGAVAVNLVGSEHFDVVLMDVQMPVMDGLEATRRLRRLPPPTGTVPVLALTANVMASERERYLGAGMNLCLTKPVIWPDLFAALAAVAVGCEPLTPIQAAGEPAAVAPVPRVDEVPLLDRSLLEGMTRELPGAMVQKLLAQGLEGAVNSCSRLGAGLGDPEKLAQEAHRLRGTAGTFGLARVSALAGRIEDQVGRGESVADLVAELEGMIEATRGEVGQLELCA